MANITVCKTKFDERILPKELQAALETCRVRIDRSSVLGNPFTSGAMNRDRPKVIALYNEWLRACLSRDQNTCENPRLYIKSDSSVFIAQTWRPVSCVAMQNEFQSLLSVIRWQNLELLCWCAPKPCHGDVIAELLRERYESNPRNF